MDFHVVPEFPHGYHLFIEDNSPLNDPVESSREPAFWDPKKYLTQ